MQLSSDLVENIPPTKKSLAEALLLSEEILKNIELNETSLENIALKIIRLCRLINDFSMQRIMELEVAGYPTSPSGVSEDLYTLAIEAGREYESEEKDKKTIEKFIFTNSISQLENSMKINEAALAVAYDPDISFSSSNEYSHYKPHSNVQERYQRITTIQSDMKRLASRKLYFHKYALKKNLELKFSGVADDIFTRVRSRVDPLLGNLLPDSINKLNAVYENLTSDNSEDWSNAVHSCRRILQDLADAVYPPGDSIIKNGKEIKLCRDNYINRIITFIEQNTDSGRFNDIVGSHLGFLGDRLDSIFKAVQKGSHSTVDQNEAERYVIYTYLIVGDILSLFEVEK